VHPVQRADIAAAIERAASAHLGRTWRANGIVDASDRASHACAIVRGEGLDVFAKLGSAGAAAEQFEAERDGLALVGRLGGVLVPAPIGEGVLVVAGTAVLLLAALTETSPAERDAGDWRSIGEALARLHDVRGETFGLAGRDGFFGPLRQDDRPVDGGWAAFLGERRIGPWRAAARAGGNLPIELDARLDRLVDRLPDLVGPEPVPALLHGDAQQHNFVSTPAGAALIDVAPSFGHPEVDLAMLGIFHPVPRDVLDAYREVRPVADDLQERTELWRVPAYLAVIAVDGANPFGGSFIGRLADALVGLGA
jgi:fructosamine-3-kinase